MLILHTGTVIIPPGIVAVVGVGSYQPKDRSNYEPPRTLRLHCYLLSI